MRFIIEGCARVLTHINDPSQVMSTVQLNPRIVKKPKFLFNTGFFPKRARAASSLESRAEVTEEMTPGRECIATFDSLSESMVV
ncbi:hypothetical protein RRF57_001509 [Xylaria bambusicola]|uniref:Uncharacterized protein n=1 Tax=Xylaria bambusicola TaxID=326684 RepID=A0AAN7UBM1_9PEZI